MSGLEQEYKGKVHGQNLDATTPENKKIVKELGFENHGLVIRSSDGKVLWRQPDHEVRMEDVRKELDRLLAEPARTAATSRGDMRGPGRGVSSG